MYSVCRCSLLVWRRSFLKKGTTRDLFLPRPGSAPGRIWPKNNNTCKGPWVLHAYQVSSKSIKRFWRRSRKCESLRTTDDGRTTDGRTDDGRCAMTIAHLSLRLRWAKKRLLLRCIHHFKSNWINNIDHMRISGNEPSSVILRQTKKFPKLKTLTRKYQNMLKPKLQFQSILYGNFLMLSKRYESTEIDRRTWLHVPSGTYRSTSRDTHEVVEI